MFTLHILFVLTLRTQEHDLGKVHTGLFIQHKPRTLKRRHWKQVTSVAASDAVVKKSSDAGVRLEPMLSDQLGIIDDPGSHLETNEFEGLSDPDCDGVGRQARVLRRQMLSFAHRVALDPDDGMEL